MADPMDLENLEPDHVFDGGDLDCGSGLVLLIRENMLRVKEGGILEMRSREPTVGDDLPPWCRMVGHAYLGSLAGPDHVRYFVRRGTKPREDQKALADDKEKAKDYEWRARIRVTGPLESTVYCRNFSFSAGQPASFEERDRHPSAVEFLLAALGTDLTTGFANECSRDRLEIDDIELSIRGRLHNVLAHLGLEDGDPSFERLQVKCFASTLEDETKVRSAWNRTLSRSPLASTLQKAVPIEIKLSIV